MQPLLSLPNTFIVIRPPITSCSLINKIEIAFSPIHLTFQKQCRISTLDIKAEGSKRGRPRKNTSPNETEKEEDGLKNAPPSIGKAHISASQDKIIALFSRIQSSISKDEPAVRKRKGLRNQRDKQTAGAIHEKYQRRKEVAGSIPIIPTRTETLEVEITNNIAHSNHIKVARPSSNFVKKLPIRQPPSIPENIGNLSKEQLGKELTQTENIDAMKLPALKQLAKEKGIKGYSKLKKGELLELIKGLIQSD